MKTRLLGLLVLLALTASAIAQQPIQQSGSVTPGHVVCWVTNSVARDCGTAPIPFATAFGVTSQGPLGICVNSAPNTGPYNQICLGNQTNTSNGIITFNNVGQTPGTLSVVVNGTTVPIPTGLPQPLGPVQVTVRSSSAPTVTVLTTDYFLCLDPTNNAITVNLPPAPTSGMSFLVKDCTGTSNLHSITITPASGNIDGSATFVLSLSFASTAVTYTGGQWSIN